MNQTSRTAQHAFQQREWTDRPDMEPRQQPLQGVDQTFPCWQGPAARSSLPSRKPSIRQRWSTLCLCERYYSVGWTSLVFQRPRPVRLSSHQCRLQDMTQPTGDQPRWLELQREDPSLQRGFFLHTPQSSISSLVRRARAPERQARTPVRQARTPVRQAKSHSESRESRSCSPLSRSSSVESPARDESPVNFTAAMDPDAKRAIIWTNDGLVFWCIYVSLGLNKFKSGSYSEAPFNLFHAPLTTCLGSLLWSTPLQNSSPCGLGDPSV